MNDSIIKKGMTMETIIVCPLTLNSQENSPLTDSQHGDLNSGPCDRQAERLDTYVVPEKAFNPQK
jgi:hypothetical protein